MSSATVSLVESIREVARESIAPSASAVDRERSFPESSVRALADQGALGLLVPESFGGAGGGLAQLVEACEAVGAACASSGMVFLMHAVTAATIAAGGGERAGEFLEEMAAGRTLGTLAFSERGTGAHFYAPELSAERENGGVRIRGRKSFVTSGGHAGLYLVLVQSGDGEGLDSYAVTGADSVRFEGEWDGLGMAGNSSVAAEFDCLVDDGSRIGGAGEGQALVFTAVAPFFLAGLAAVNVGIASAALGTAVEHASTRRYASGESLAEIQSVQHALAEMDMSTRAARLMVREAARLGDAGDDDALVTLMEAKVLATETAASVTGRALEVCGGQGYTRALPVERHLRDARAGAVMAPTNGVLRNWIGKALAGLPVP
ncbi:MAG TPA: acyl-CoA dehydrogenase family protein [Solirubrobacteraceae bacterium]|jgi:alkylation response protein AidB-like acyl-CoA dehydrogenase|nr:acyl-CoA dehydrogenase family protein [Solirubrobacteraceae bacterium]